MKQPTQAEIDDFCRTVWRYYRTHGRDLPWRRDTRPYYVLVSELMLQQTQVGRVVPKFESFVAEFPNFEVLARAALAEVLRQWLGLGYNRRARFLHAAVRAVVSEHGGALPQERTLLEALPGIGPNTAGAILAYAFNQPAVFIETNIRSVYLHHFFAGEQAVSDKQIAELAGTTLDERHPREWYWALMDYGTFLKTENNNIARSRHYKKQTKFAGSQRQMRGELMRQLSHHPRNLQELADLLPGDLRLEPALQGLLRDGLVEQSGQHFYLTGQGTLR